MWPVWEAVASWVLKTQRSEDPESKSMLMVCPPICTGERYSTSPCSGVAVTSPVPLVAADTPPVEAALAAPVPVACATPATAVEVFDPFALPFAFPFAAASVIPPIAPPAAP